MRRGWSVAATKESDDALFDAVAALVAGDTAATNGLAKTTQVGGAYASNAFLVGNYDGTTLALVRVGDPKRTKNFPRVEIGIQPGEERPTPDHTRVEGLFYLHLFTNREAPNGFGSQQNVAIRVRQVVNRQAMSTQGGWYFSTLVRKRGIQAHAADKEQHYVIPFAYTMTTGAGGGF